ncbi:MAG: PEP-CTERM sorting domain-containing protein [Pseudomonadota bacterium]
MKRTLFTIAAFLFCTVGAAQANTVTVKLENLYTSGIKIAAMQIDFLKNDLFGYPFLGDEKNIFELPDIEAKSDFGAGSSIVRHPSFINNWTIDYLDKYDAGTKISLARGCIVYSDSENEQYALRDGFLLELHSNDTAFAIDPASVEIFDFINTRDPVQGLGIHQTFAGPDQILTISPLEEPPSTVPMPASVFLLGSGLVGLIGFRRKRSGRQV